MTCLQTLSLWFFREDIIRLQGQVDKQYAGLKDLAEERRRKVELAYHLFKLKREVDDLEQWIAERDVIASSPEMGQDLDHATVSKHRENVHWAVHCGHFILRCRP